MRNDDRWPAIEAMLAARGPLRVEVEGGLVYEVHGDNPIERALLLSDAEPPDHVWEPQTTRVLCALAQDGGDVIVGGAFIGDQALPVALALAPPARVHAFEPMAESARRLERNAELSGVHNVVVRRVALWDRPGALWMAGESVLASAHTERPASEAGEQAEGTTLDAYVSAEGIGRVGLIALDLEGGEPAALRGAQEVLAEGPHVVFEVHARHLDWNDGLEAIEPVRLLARHGYRLFAIRDHQSNVAMGGQPVEVVPLDQVHLEGPLHGFNLLASRDPGVVERLGAVVVTGVSPKLLPDRGPLHAPAS